MYRLVASENHWSSAIAMEAAAKLPRRSSSTPRFFLQPPTSLAFLHHRKHHHPNLWSFFFAASLITFFLCLLLLSTRIDFPRFSIVIDAGSTGTRIHVYGYTFSPETMLPSIDRSQTWEMNVSPGLSSYSSDPAIAGSSLLELLDFVKSKVPEDRWGDTEITLMATAGLRLLDPEVRDRILDSCRRILTVSGFRFRDEWASMISGSDEGVFAWIAANYALGKLGGEPWQTAGIIELGGASAQITFVTSETLPSELSHMVNFGGTSYSLYSSSFLGLGQNLAHESVRKLLGSGKLKSTGRMYPDPCSPGGNFSECKSASLMLLQKEKDRIYVPKLQGRFLATENFFYTSKFFGLGPVPILSDFESAGRHFCEQDWVELRSRYQMLGEEDFSRYCFSSAYIVALLHGSLGISMADKRLWFSNEVGNIPLDWALGAFIMKAKERQLVAHGEFLILPSFFLLLILLLTFAVWLILRLRKPPVRTVFDLEKGQYIVTRISR